MQAGNIGDWEERLRTFDVLKRLKVVIEAVGDNQSLHMLHCLSIILGVFH